MSVLFWLVFVWPPWPQPAPTQTQDQTFTVPGFVDGHGTAPAYVHVTTHGGRVLTHRHHTVARTVERVPARRWLRIGQCIGNKPCVWEDVDVPPEDWRRIAVGASWQGQLTYPLACTHGCASTAAP